MTAKGIRLFMLPLLASLLMACGERQTVYHAYHTLPMEGWHRQDTLPFDIPLPDSLATYRLSVEVRHRGNYPYRNLRLLLCHEDAPDRHPSQDSLNLLLATPTGRWTGDGLSGLYQNSFPVGPIRIASLPSLPSPQDTTIRCKHFRLHLHHLLPDSLLPGLSDIGIKVERMGE
ncbi:MAG: gliding motility lipoprotein GldH [Bacteroides sp.]|nr:gliding motility lipoprotein GldH [Bacteroides sp.]